MQQDPRVEEIRRKNLAKVNKERVKLGMQPFRPIAATN
jgi:hypothetical protein